MIPWIKEGELDDIVISSRIRLARNFADEKFPAMMDEDAEDRIYLKTIKAVSPLGDYTFLRIKDLSEIERNALVEQYIASKELIGNPLGGLAKNSDETIDVMINEEDHLRMQAILSGFELEKALNLILDFEKSLNVKFAYDNEFGYLTSCPTNTGTGMRASIMLHVPSIMMSGQIQSIINAVSKMGMTIRGIYGEGSDSTGNMVQLSNQVTLGLNEREIIENLKTVSQKIIDNEKNARSVLMELDRVKIEDKIFRSFGILKYVRRIDTSEMVELLSDVKLGVALGLIKGVNNSELHNLLLEGRPNLLQMSVGKKLDEEERDWVRANLIRHVLKHATEGVDK